MVLLIWAAHMNARRAERPQAPRRVRLVRQQALGARLVQTDHPARPVVGAPLPLHEPAVVEVHVDARVGTAHAAGRHVARREQAGQQAGQRRSQPRELTPETAVEVMGAAALDGARHVRKGRGGLDARGAVLGQAQAADDLEHGAIVQHVGAQPAAEARGRVGPDAKV